MLFAAAGPLVFAGAFMALFVGSWLVIAAMIAAMAAPWTAAVLIVTEWIRRRAEDRWTGIPRPDRLPPGNNLSLRQDIDRANVSCYGTSCGVAVGTRGRQGWPG